MLRIERRVLRGDRIESLGQRRPCFGKALPAIGGRNDVRRRCQWHLIDHRSRDRNHIIVLRTLHDVARRAIIRGPLIPGALSEDIAQAQENEDRQRQEDDGVNIHVAFAF